MSARSIRPLIALGALLLVIGAVALAAVSHTSPTAASNTYVIEITASGFNPGICRINRGDSVRWQNLDSVPHQVGFNAAGNETAWTTEVIAPGATSAGTFEVQGGFNGTYHLVDDPSVTGILQGPPTSNTWNVSCSPNPPTPTPSPTPSITATPTATATATPTPRSLPPRCVGQYGCAVAPELAKDGA